MIYLYAYYCIVSLLLISTLIYIFSPLLKVNKVDKDIKGFIFSLYLANLEEALLTKDSKTGFLNLVVADLFTFTQNSESICTVVLDKVTLQLNSKTQKVLIKEFSKMYFKNLLTKNSEKLLGLYKKGE